MLLATDVHYRTHFAKAVGIQFDHWESEVPSSIHEKIITEVAEYIPGQFYKRELPCIMEILKEVDITKLEAIIVDGYVVLDDHGKFGLGAHLYETLNHQVPIIGVAKKQFYNNRKHVAEVFRGISKNPLFVTSIGTDLQKAQEAIQNMVGTYRMPDLLRLLDQKTKSPVIARPPNTNT